MESIFCNRARSSSIARVGALLPNNAFQRTRQKRRAAEGERWANDKE